MKARERAAKARWGKRGQVENVSKGVVLLKTRHWKTGGSRDSKIEGRKKPGNEARGKSKTNSKKARKAGDASKRESS